MTKRKIKGFGWRPDIPDGRDYQMKAPEGTLDLPPVVDLETDPAMPAVYDQGNLGSCTANAIAGIYNFCLAASGLKFSFMPSRLFIYYNERAIEGTTSYDSGGYIRDGIKTIAELGVCHETNWKYDISKFANKPTKTAYKNALLHQSLEYRRVDQTLESIKYTLSQRLPIAFGFGVYEAFESDEVATTGMVPMPGPNEKEIAGHAPAIVGYDESKGLMKVRNSWSKNWGVRGYCFFPYDYILDNNLCDDLWCITKIELRK